MPFKTNEIKPATAISQRTFGYLPDGREITEYRISNEHHYSVSFITYGGIITSLVTPDKRNKPGDIVLGFDNLESYLADTYLSKMPYFGAIIGRYAGRIAKGKFNLEGQEYTLATNNRGNHIHGGKTGFDKVIWQATLTQQDGMPAVMLKYLSKDGEEGYPGNLQATVIYSLSNENELKITYQAETDKATPLTLTNHSYFNLSAGHQPDALSHLLTINADQYLETDKDYIPSGKQLAVSETALDFTTPQTIGSRIQEVAYGYNHAYVLNTNEGQIRLAASVVEPVSGRKMEVFTSAPSLIFYAGYFLDGSLTGKKGRKYPQYGGFALETQHFPDAPNHAGFPSAVLRPGERYSSITIFKFSRLA